MANLSNGGRIEFHIRPQVIQGGTYKGFSYNGNTSTFHMYNAYTVGGREYETIDTIITFDTQIQETDEKIVVKVTGVSSYRLRIASKSTGTPFPVHDRLVSPQGEIFNVNYTSGVGFNYDRTSPNRLAFGDTYLMEISKEELAHDKSKHVNIKLMRFDDLAADPSGDNKIELYLDAIAYFAPPTFRPWATRKSGRFLSHDKHRGWFRVRKSGSWVDKSEMNIAEAGVPNVGSSRIRKSGTWKGQQRIGD